MKAATFLLVGAALLLSGCSRDTNNQPPQQAQATATNVPPRVVMSSLAESACSNAGGTLTLSYQLDGSAIGMCQLANGRRCSENALAGSSCAR